MEEILTSGKLLKLLRKEETKVFKLKEEIFLLKELKELEDLKELKELKKRFKALEKGFIKYKNWSRVKIAKLEQDG